MTSSLAEAFKDVPMKLKHIIPLDFDSVNSVPDSHQWPKSNVLSDHTSPPDFISGSKSSSASPIPVIDFLAPNVADLIGEACEKFGIFMLVNHGVPSDLIHDVECQSKRFFGLSMDEKMKVLRSPGSSNGYGVARTQTFYDKAMWHEGFTIVGSAVDHAKQIWPCDYELFCKVMEDYQNQMKLLSNKLLVLMLKALRLSEDVLEWTPTIAEGALQLNSYPPCPNPENAMGLASHTDSMLFTILHRSKTKGLQILREGGTRWITVPPSPVVGNGEEALVINIGDLMHIFSNGRFHNVCHRVLVNQERHRYSFAFFYGPPMNSKVAPFHGLPCPRFQSTTFKEFLSLKAKFFEKACSMLTIPEEVE